MRRSRLFMVVVTALAALAAAVMVLPFIWQALVSLKPLHEVESGHVLPRDWRPENYADVFRQIAFGRYVINSVFVAAAVTFLQTLTSAMAAFAFSRLRWPGRDKIFLAYLATLMIPGVITIIPNFTLMWQLGLYDTYLGLILPASFSAFGTFLLRQFMLGVPTSLDESARLDGASEWQVFWEIIMPTISPALVTLAIITFLGNYTSFFWPLIMVRAERLRTLPLGLLFFDSSYGTQTNLLMAASLMAIIPSVLVFCLFQRRIISGIQAGAVKG